jgi:predicted transcriptional regulator
VTNASFQAGIAEVRTSFAPTGTWTWSPTISVRSNIKGWRNGARTDQIRRVYDMSKRSLTTCEAEAMNVVWAKQNVTVQDVVNAIPRPLAYTTVMTTMKILEEKGFICRGEKRGRAYVYRPLVSCESASQNTLSAISKGLDQVDGPKPAQNRTDHSGRPSGASISN